MLNSKMRLYLIDGNSYIYRAFFAIRGLTDSSGRPTNAIYGFTTMLLKIIEGKKPDAIAICFDSPQPTERHIIFEKYKAHRPEAPDELRQQIPHIKRLIDAFRIKTFTMPGYEADDIIATIASHAKGKGAEVFIVTGDKDMLQLIHDSVWVYDPSKDVVLDEKYVLEKYGVPPSRIVEYMALVGDATDNIPGVKGIGEKTAKELLSRFRSLEELSSCTEKIEKEKLRKLIEQNKDIMFLSKKLATINTDLPISIELEALRTEEPDWQKVLSLFKEFEFTSLMRIIPGAPPPERQYETISTPERLKEFIESIKEKTSFALNTETEGPDPMKDPLLGISLCPEEKKAAYIPLDTNAVELLRPILEGTKEKIGHDIKFDIRALRTIGIELGGPLYDTMIASYLINPVGEHSLENISLEYLLRKKKTFAEITGGRPIKSTPIEKLSEYSCDNSELSLELKDILFRKIEEMGLSCLYFEIEMPLIRVLADMEDAGIKIDIEKLKNLSKEIEGELDALQKRIFFLAGQEFNINSPKQLGKILFETLRLKPGRKKKTGYSTELSVLEELSKEHELPKEVLQYRSLAKLKGTYIDALPLLINPKTARLHSSFNQVSTATGRLSSSEPNLQNIPIRGTWGRKIREAFIAEKGNLIITADYSQIELRILAHISGDTSLLDAFKKDIDIHAQTAMEVFGVPLERVTPEMRRAAKGVNFGIVYGITPFGLSEALGITKEKASEYIERYFKNHPSIKTYIDRTIKETEQKGYSETLTGRKRPIPELRSKDSSIRQLGQRLAVNSPIQGTAADLIKSAMIHISEKLKTHAPKAKMILQVHDELIFECPKTDKDIVMEIVKKEMESPHMPCKVELSVPLKVELGYGDNWAEAAH